MESHLLQMRGLKHPTHRAVRHPNTVASFTDAWIETWIWSGFRHLPESHLLQMRGLKLGTIDNVASRSSRIFYRCVD